MDCDVSLKCARIVPEKCLEIKVGRQPSSKSFRYAGYAESKADHARDEDVADLLPFSPSR